MGKNESRNSLDPFEEQEKARSRLDLLILFLACEIVYISLSRFDAITVVIGWLRSVVDWNADELFLISVLALIAGSVFVFRRWTQLQREIQRRRALERRLTALEGFVPICSYCKSLRDESGHWSSIESLLTTDYSLHFSNGVCPRCEEIYVKPELGAFLSDTSEREIY